MDVRINESHPPSPNTSHPPPAFPPGPPRGRAGSRAPVRPVRDGVLRRHKHTRSVRLAAGEELRRVVERLVGPRVGASPVVRPVLGVPRRAVRPPPLRDAVPPSEPLPLPIPVEPRLVRPRVPTMQWCM